MNTFMPWRQRLFWLLAIGFLLAGGPARALLPFPLTAGQRGYVKCLENTNYTYDCYLPSGYSTNGTPLAILYTMSPSGGGEVSIFQTACSAFNFICIGITNIHNNMSWDQILRAFDAVSRDVRLRILYDPTQEYAGGLSGGGECSYMFARFRAQHVAGVIEMAGWLGRSTGSPNVGYCGIDRVQTNLMVIRTTGNSDTDAIFYNPFDSNFLATCHVRLADLSFTGGHQVPPESTLETCLQWLEVHHRTAGANDRNNAFTMSTNWQARVAADQSAAVFRECVSNLMTFPRSWYAYQAQLMLDQLLTNYNALCQWDMSNLAQGDYASDFFYYYARGAANNADYPRYYSCLKALTGVTATNDYVGTVVISNIVETVVFPTNNGTISITTITNDHSEDIVSLLMAHGYGQPVLQMAIPPEGSLLFSVSETAPWLQYSVQVTSDLVNNPWQWAFEYTVADSGTVWSANGGLPGSAGNSFYRVLTIPGGPAGSPYWPVWTPQ